MREPSTNGSHWAANVELAERILAIGTTEPNAIGVKRKAYGATASRFDVRRIATPHRAGQSNRAPDRS